MDNKMHPVVLLSFKKNKQKQQIFYGIASLKKIGGVSRWEPPMFCMVLIICCIFGALVSVSSSRKVNVSVTQSKHTVTLKKKCGLLMCL